MKTRAKQPPTPADRGETLRHEIVSLLKEESHATRELSERVGISEKDVLEHLEHIRFAQRSAFVVTPAECMWCGFTFRKRERLKGPGRCPVCHSEHIAEPAFSIR